jgi:hypothetical protein
MANFARVGKEKIAVEAEAAEGWFALTRWTLHEFRFAAEGVITAKGASYPVRLIYPDQFPAVPCWVEPQDPAVQWTKHQYGAGGCLCLELRPDNWSPQASGADVLRSAYNLLSTENPLGDGEQQTVTSAHHIGALQAHDWSGEQVLISEPCVARLRARTASELQAVTWPGGDSKWPILVTDAEDRTQAVGPPTADFSVFRLPLAVTLLQGDGAQVTATSRAALAEAFGATLSAEELQSTRLFVVASDAGLHTFYSADADKIVDRPWVMLPDERNLRAGRAADTTAKKVAIIGQGSVGSKIAEILARADTRHMVLVDGDVMLPGNLERHALDWRDIGTRKVDGVARRLKQIAPHINLTAIASNLNWQVSAKAYAGRIETIAACDLIIDASGDAATGLFLGALAQTNDRAFVSINVFEGGLGCVIARAIPGRDPAFVDGRAAYLGYCEGRAVEPPKCGRRRYESLTDNGLPIMADDAAVTIAAGHAGRVALDILDNHVSAEDTAWLLLGFRKGWLFERHGDAIALDVGAPVAAENRDDPDARAFALALAQEALNAAKAAE